MSERADTAIAVVDLSKNYGSVAALRAINLEIPSGQYFVLLGPSGGGKTTLLRLIGGFLRPTTGRVLLHGEDVTELPPNERRTAMVFQSYALFPHMNVERNVGYGLRLRGLAKAEIRAKVDGMLRLVGLTGLNRRMPHELSGGQQQRVQLARSLVLDSDVLLLDEPLASLDAKLRKDMCLELKHIQQQVGITFLHVTHNQEEAMTIADTIAIIADGRLIEQATPESIYRKPQARFTAEFIGEKNLLQGSVVASGDDEITVDLGHVSVRAPSEGQRIENGATVWISIPSEQLRFVSGPAGNMECLPGVFIERLFLGLTVGDVVRLADGTQVVIRSLAADAADGLSPGQEVMVGWNRSAARLHTH